MLQQPRLPPTGQRQAIEVHIKWREVLAQKQSMLGILSEATGNSPEKLDQVCVLSAGSSSWQQVADQPSVMAGRGAGGPA